MFGNEKCRKFQGGMSFDNKRKERQDARIALNKQKKLQRKQQKRKNFSRQNKNKNNNNDLDLNKMISQTKNCNNSRLICDVIDAILTNTDEKLKYLQMNINMEFKNKFIFDIIDLYHSLFDIIDNNESLFIQCAIKKIYLSNTFFNGIKYLLSNNGKILLFNNDIKYNYIEIFYRLGGIMKHFVSLKKKFQENNGYNKINICSDIINSIKKNFSLLNGDIETQDIYQQIYGLMFYLCDIIQFNYYTILISSQEIEIILNELINNLVWINDWDIALVNLHLTYKLIRLCLSFEKCAHDDIYDNQSESIIKNIYNKSLFKQFISMFTLTCNDILSKNNNNNNNKNNNNNNSNQTKCEIIECFLNMFCCLTRFENKNIIKIVVDANIWQFLNEIIKQCVNVNSNVNVNGNGKVNFKFYQEWTKLSLAIYSNLMNEIYHLLNETNSKFVYYCVQLLSCRVSNGVKYNASGILEFVSNKMNDNNVCRIIIDDLIKNNNLFKVIFDGIDDCTQQSKCIGSQRDVKEYLHIVENIIFNDNSDDNKKEYCKIFETLYGLKIVEL